PDPLLPRELGAAPQRTSVHPEPLRIHGPGARPPHGLLEARQDLPRLLPEILTRGGHAPSLLRPAERRSGVPDQLAHLPHRTLHPDEHGTAHHAVPDVQLLDLRDRRDGRDVLVREPMTRVYVQPPDRKSVV